MKKILIALSLLIVSSCGTIGIGENHKVKITNNSPDPILVQGEKTTKEIAPNTSEVIEENNPLTIKSKNQNCDAQIVSQELNATAIVLDLIVLGIIPLLIDIATSSLKEMPDNYNYSCVV